MANHTDPFDDLLTLEDTLYTSAHAQGVSDGARAGRIEGRIFGLEKGFEKYAALGELHGRGAVWGSRITGTANPTTSPSLSSEPNMDAPTTTSTTTTTTAATTGTLPPLPTPSSRLISNTSLLYHLTDPLTFSTANTEPSVADFDDRFKRAGAKAKVIERMIGETAPGVVVSGERGNGDGERVTGKGRGKAGKGGKGDDNMEDFAGSRLIG